MDLRGERADTGIDMAVLPNEDGPRAVTRHRGTGRGERSFQLQAAAVTRPSAQPAIDPSHLAHAQATLQTLRAAQRRAFFIVAAVMGLYLLIAVLMMDAGGSLTTALFGQMNINLMLVMSQFGVTVCTAGWYGWHARKSLDPIREQLRALFGQSGDYR